MGKSGAYGFHDVVVFLCPLLLLHGGSVGRLCVYHQHHTHLHGDYDGGREVLFSFVHSLLGVLHVRIFDGHDSAVCR